MTGKLAALLATLAYVATGASGIFIVAQPSSLGISGDTLQIIAGWCAIAGSLGGLVVVALRRNLVPGAETGIGSPNPDVAKA